MNAVILTVTNEQGDVYDPAFLAKYKAIADKIYYNDNINRALFEALSQRKVRAVSGAAGSVQFDPMMWPDVPKAPADIAKFKRLLLQQFGGYYVSADQKSLLISADFKEGSNFKDVYQFLEQVRQQYEGKGLSIAMVGRPVLLGFVDTVLPTVLVIFGISVLAIAGILWIYFRSILGVLVPIGVSLAVTIWGLVTISIRCCCCYPSLSLPRFCRTLSSSFLASMKNCLRVAR